MATKTAPATTDDPGTKLLDDFFPEDSASTPAETPKEESTPVAEPKQVESKPKHPAYLVRSAKNVGFDDGEIEGYTTAELKEAVNIVAMTRQQDARERQVLESVNRGPDGKFVKKEETPAPEVPFSLKDAGVDLSDADEFTQGLFAKALKPILDKFKKLQSDYEEKIGAIEARDQQREVNAHFDKMDQLFATNEAVFGKGARSKLTKGSPELKRRVAVINAIPEIKTDNPEWTIDECFEAASNDLFGSLAPKVEPKAEVVEEVEEPIEKKDPHNFRNGSTIKPTTREGPPKQKGTKAAIEHVTALMKDRSAIVDTSEQDELPD